MNYKALKPKYKMNTIKSTGAPYVRPVKHTHTHTTPINSTGSICDQKTCKIFVSSRKESMTGHMGVNGIY
jgi:hypothetical protein